MYSVLVIDDEQAQRDTLAGFLRKRGYDTFKAGSGTEGIEICLKKAIDVVLTDYKMPDKDGLEVLKSVKRINPNIAVIIMTAFGTVESAVEAMKAGAYHYITKPIDLQELELLLQKALERKLLISENKRLKAELSEKYRFDNIISNSPQMEEVLNLALRVAASKASVLITGESGTGKEMVAKAIHYSSPRKNKPFLAVNCAALNENLLESELFGHERGAFTGAISQHKGKFEQADGGTLFIDEVGDMPLVTQVKLLRVLQENELQRVGGNELIKFDVRIISATNKNLETEIEKGNFREDLYYRLNVISIHIPPLRNRKEDIPFLLDYFLEKYARQNEKQIEGISKEAMDILMKYDYPGNVRELKNIIERSVVLSRSPLISTFDLPIQLRGLKSEMAKQNSSLENNTLTQQVANLEITLIKEALEKTKGNQTKAAKLLGINERNLRYKMKKYAMK